MKSQVQNKWIFATISFPARRESNEVIYGNTLMLKNRIQNCAVSLLDIFKKTTDNYLYFHLLIISESKI